MFSRGLGGYAQALWYTMPTTKRKAPPAPGAANALASALGVAKFMRIKPGELLQHEVDVGRRFNIPGSYWGDQCDEGEENQMFAAKVVEVTLTHEFQGTSMRQPALRFVLTGAPPSFSSFVLFFSQLYSVGNT